MHTRVLTGACTNDNKWSLSRQCLCQAESYLRRRMTELSTFDLCFVREGEIQDRGSGPIPVWPGTHHPPWQGPSESLFPQLCKVRTERAPHPSLSFPYCLWLEYATVSGVPMCMLGRMGYSLLPSGWPADTAWCPPRPLTRSHMQPTPSFLDRLQEF